MKTTLFILTAISLVSADAVFAQTNSTDTTQHHTSSASLSVVAKLEDKVRRGTKSLSESTQRTGFSVNTSMEDLHAIVLASTERARILAEWDIQSIRDDAESKFDATIEAIEQYLNLVADDGAIHQASNRIRTAALEHARMFREKAGVKSRDKYVMLAESMDQQASEVTKVWEAIRDERKSAVTGLQELKDAKELYIDIKAAFGIAKAVAELKEVKADLVKLSQSMIRVQQAVSRTPDSIEAADS